MDGVQIELAYQKYLQCPNYFLSSIQVDSREYILDFREPMHQFLKTDDSCKRPIKRGDDNIRTCRPQCSSKYIGFEVTNHNESKSDYTLDGMYDNKFGGYVVPIMMNILVGIIKE